MNTLKVRTPSLHALVAIGLATNPLVWVVGLVAVHALAIWVFVTLFREACRQQWTLTARKPRRAPDRLTAPEPQPEPPAPTPADEKTAVDAQSSADTAIDLPAVPPLETDKQAEHPAVTETRLSARRARKAVAAKAAPCYAQVTRPEAAKKKSRAPKAPSAKKLQSMTGPELIALGRELGVKGLHPRMRTETLLTRLRAHQEAARAD